MSGGVLALFREVTPGLAVPAVDEEPWLAAAEAVHHVVTHLDTANHGPWFASLETLLVQGHEDTKALIVVGFLHELFLLLRQRHAPPEPFTLLFGPVTLEAWQAVETLEGGATPLSVRFPMDLSTPDSDTARFEAFMADLNERFPAP